MDSGLDARGLAERSFGFERKAGKFFFPAEVEESEAEDVVSATATPDEEERGNEERMRLSSSLLIEIALVS